MGRQHPDERSDAGMERRGLHGADPALPVMGQIRRTLHERSGFDIRNDDAPPGAQGERAGGSPVHADPMPELRGLVAQAAMGKQA
ncbi:hypothetical protein D9M68_763580 [compost metagenome]